MESSARARCEPVSPESGTLPDVHARDPLARQAILAAWVEDRKLSLYVLLAIAGGTAYITFLIFRPFLTALFLALVLAVAFFPVFGWFVRRLRSNYLAALSTTLLALVVLGVPFVFISVRLASQATNTYSYFLQLLRDPSSWPRPLDPLVDAASEITNIPAPKLKAELTVRGRILASRLFAIVASFGRRLAQQMWTIALAFVFLLPLLRYSSEFRLGAVALLPLSRDQAGELSRAIHKGIIADVYGVVAVGFAEGMLIALGFWVVGISSPLFWGIVAVVLSCIPFLGVSMVWVPACLVLAFQARWSHSILLFVWCGIVVSTAEGIVRSAVVSGRARVNSMVIMLSIMGGLVAFGAVGIFVGPVVLVLVGTLVRILREEHANVCAARLQPPRFIPQ